MGDYNKLIVACTVKGEIKEELKAKVEELGLNSSAYQSQEIVISIEPNPWHHRKEDLNVVLVGQTKYGRGQSEFCAWLKPHVLQGSGENDVFAIAFTECSDTPMIWKLDAQTDEHEINNLQG
jgi:hypothetical protein